MKNYVLEILLKNGKKIEQNVCFMDEDDLCDNFQKKCDDEKRANIESMDLSKPIVEIKDVYNYNYNIQIKTEDITGIHFYRI